MRIALVVERLAASGGGVEQAAWHTADALCRSGESVHVLCRESESPPAGVHVHPVPVAAFWQPWRVWAFSRRTASLIDRTQPPFDVVHAFTRTRVHDVYRAGAGRHADFLRATYGAAGAAARRLSPRHALALRADRRIFRDPARIIQCPSALVGDALVRRAGVDPSRIAVLPNGVDAERFAPRPTAAADAIRRRHARAGETVWLFAGSGARRKGLDVAIAALAGTRDPGAVLWVAGRDAPAEPTRTARRLGVVGRVRFLGPRRDMPDVYRAADGLLLPTRYDPFANVCLEAAAAGLPVVSSRRNGAMEVLGDAGVAVDDPGDDVAFARALDRLADPDLRRSLGAGARKRALACDWAQHAERLRALYARVAAERARGRAADAR